MGNICNSSQKKNKDAESEVSEAGENDDKKNEERLEAEEEVQEKETSEKTELIPEPNTANETPSVETPATAPQIDCDDKEEKNKKIYSKIFGCPVSSKTIPKNKKIVLYILMSNKYQYEEQLEIISDLFPKLWRHCKLKGFELTASFTHHEILSKSENNPSQLNEFVESSHGIRIVHDEVENCMFEFSRHANSYIIPVLFTGPSLGKACLPRHIKEEDFTFMIAIATDEQVEVLRKFYELDNSSHPNHYSLALSSDLSENNIEKILEALIELLPINLKDSYLANTFEKIITDTIVTRPDLVKRSIWLQNGLEPKAVTAGSSIEVELSRQLLNTYALLRNEVPVNNTIRTFVPSEEQQELNVILESTFKSYIDSIFTEHNTKFRPSRNTMGLCRQVVSEVEAVKRQSMEIYKYSKSTDALDAVASYIQGDSQSPFVVFGRMGEGKSVLAADIAVKLNDWVEDAHLILRYTNMTALCCEITSLIASIAEELSILVTGRPTRTPYDLVAYKSLIEDLLDSSNLFIVMVIDSIDKIDGLENFDWLPKITRSKLKIIFTMTNSKDLQQSWIWIDLLTKREIPKANFHMLSDVSTTIANCTLRDKIISEMPRLKLNDKEQDLAKFNQQFFSALESEIDVQFLRTLLLLISISTYGIYETDCLKILQEECKIDKVYALIIWSKFCWIVGPLLHHSSTVTVVDNLFLNIAVRNYSSFLPTVRECAKNYYESLSDFLTDDQKHVISLNAEKFVKVPLFDVAVFYESKERCNADLYFIKAYFTDLQWIINKIDATGCFQYLYDILQAEAVLKVASTSLQHMIVLKQFLRLHMAQLNYDASQLYTFLQQYLSDLLVKDPTLERNMYIKKWHATLKDLQIVHLECLNSHKNEISNSGRETYNDVVSLKAPGHYIAAISSDGDEICVWDVPNCKPVRKLKSVPQPSLLCSIKDFEAAVLCKREIKVIDLKEGKYKSTLKGVMNQKMPYFGLHDESHLACLSRNRMYVNLMNLETGDCVTSFKAGEDRFLNSLIISGNGRILVCGDESQKPFSLLVWHLTQRRLLYDLRIPHHDLFTSLSAITYEGSYVSVVAKEITESGPNFIVVYDLQSGTLFQKLKPSCNTVAIAISQANGCVIAGLENAEILIWDLVTGNCRHTLIGHNAPVTRLKLDPLGSCLVSGDSEGRDLSLRLWELSTGKSLAVFSPSQKTSSCEILDNGMFIILALENVPELLILCLRNYEKMQTRVQSEQYNNEFSECKVFNLAEG